MDGAFLALFRLAVADESMRVEKGGETSRILCICLRELAAHGASKPNRACYLLVLTALLQLKDRLPHDRILLKVRRTFNYIR